jgi:hypothetical protein
VGASGYLNAVGNWPQIPMQLMTDQPTQFAKAWVQALEPYSVPHSSWICPTLQRSSGLSIEAVEKDENYRVDYIAAPFGDTPSAPRLTGNRPWFAEKSAAHSRGQLIVFSDGSTAALLDLANKK